MRKKNNIDMYRKEKGYKCNYFKGNLKKIKVG